VIILEEKTLESKTIYEGKIFDVLVDMVELPSGRKTTREVVRHRGAVGLIPVLEDGRIVLAEQYRYPTGEVLLEIPAGRLEEGEDPASTAGRELLEETGYIAGSIRGVATFYTAPGYTSEKLFLFVVTDLEKAEAKPDLDENIRLREVSVEEAVALIKKGEIKDGKTIAGLLFYTTFIYSS
jgi:ADP-ribose pyrophosphatase